MNLLNEFIPQNITNAFGWMILNSLWQGILVAVLLSAALLFLNKSSARIRYLISIGALLIFTTLCVRTFIDNYNSRESNNVPVNENAAINSEENSDLMNQRDISVSSPEKYIHSFQTYFVGNIPLIVLLYLAGLLFFTLKLSGGYLYTQRIKHYKTKAPDKKYQILLNRISEYLQIKRRVKLLESSLIGVPLTIGYLKPVVLLPAGSLTGIPYDQLEAILAHELAHIKRADYLVNFFQSVVEIIFFYHPAVWFISSLIRDERENICDDLSVEITGNPALLAKALLAITAPKVQPQFVMSLFKNQNKIIRRVKRMTGENYNSKLKGKLYLASAMMIILISFGLYACSSANGTTTGRSNVVYEEDDHGHVKLINTDKEDDQNTYVFYKRWKGENNKWEVTTDKGKLVSLYKNDSEVPQNQYYKYEDMIYDEIDDINDDLADARDDLDDLDDEITAIKSGVHKIKFSDDFYEDLDKMRDELRRNFNSREFKDEMKKLRESLKDIDINIDFDNDEFKREMREMKRELADIHVDIDFDNDEFHRSMKELSNQMADIKIDIPDINIDFSGLDESMKELHENLKDLDIDMSELKKEMKILKDFLNELEDEMINDGLIEEGEHIKNLEFEDGCMYLNYEKVPDELYGKYKEIYKDYYGEYPDDNSFGIHDRL